jgi:hypothetical protein
MICRYQRKKAISSCTDMSSLWDFCLTGHVFYRHVIPTGFLFDGTCFLPTYHPCGIFWSPHATTLPMVATNGYNRNPVNIGTTLYISRRLWFCRKLKHTVNKVVLSAGLSDCYHIGAYSYNVTVNSHIITYLLFN